MNLRADSSTLLEVSSGRRTESPGNLDSGLNVSWMLLERETLSHEAGEGKREKHVQRNC